MADLIITNGDSAARLLRTNGIGDDILPWRDILYEGPVSLTNSLPELSAIRAAYLALRYPQPDRDIAAEFAERDRRLARHADFDIVTLWFEHDLHDTMQLLQLLDYFAHGKRDRASLRIVHTDTYINELEPHAMRALAVNAKPVGTARMNQAQEAWARWREPHLLPWAALLHRPRLNLKHLWSAVLASQDRIPSLGNGLDEIETFIIEELNRHPRNPVDLFEQFSRHCDRAFGRYMGDWGFYAILDELAAGPAPLIMDLQSGPFRPDMEAADRTSYFESRQSLTVLGQRVLAGQEDRCDHNIIDRWIGGTHITNDNLFRYDHLRHRIISPSP